MPETEKYDVLHKALSLNLEPTTFGSFAEIGAGQEVARWFLRVGGASGTVAKTISVYDKEVSDDLYGAGTRYVSKPCLQAMLESEWGQLLAELQRARGAHTKFFTFVDTISARNYAGTNDCRVARAAFSATTERDPERPYCAYQPEGSHQRAATGSGGHPGSKPDLCRLSCAWIAGGVSP